MKVGRLGVVDDGGDNGGDGRCGVVTTGLNAMNYQCVTESKVIMWFL